ncbi:MAG: phosphatidate cytidylyltransferase, partial [Candidatus Electrothrix sp. ATG1]|nr:phosphatidate cytidylyltransferase [Candidatus Electrothrix sp. ATG1]
FLTPPLIFWFVITVGAAIALYEFYRMTDQCGIYTFLTVPIALLPMLAAVEGDATVVLVGSYLALLALVALVIFAYTRFADPLGFLVSSGFSVFYISLCSSFLVLLRFLPEGSSWLLLLTAVTAGSDTGAYYSGRAFGKKKLCPSLSPGKTINGAIGGVLTAVLATVLIGVFFLPEVGSLRLALAATSLAIVGIGGDLLESIIKRGTGIKDSGTLLGGHGGLLDRIDSLLLTAPFLYLLLFSGVL